MNKVDFEEIADEIKTMKKSVKNTPKENYRIVKVNSKAAETEVDYKPETVSYFYAEDDDKAFAYLKSQLTKLPAKSADESYYWMNANMVIGSDGKYYDDLFSDMEDWSRRLPLWKKMTMWMHVNITMPLTDFWNRLKDIFYWLKTGHNRHESWEIFSSMMGILKFNLPLLIKNHAGVPNKYCVEARKQLHEKDLDFDLEESLKKNPNTTSKEMKLANKLYEEDLNRLLLNVRLLEYYEGYGRIDVKNSDEVELSKRYPIPYKKGSWKCIDYVKLQKLEDACNNAIFNQLKDIGRCLWD